jgi:hypothetical protein
MTHHDARRTTASPRGRGHSRIWLPLTVATFVAISAAIVLAGGIPTDLDAASQPTRDASSGAGPLSLMDHSIVKSTALADEPDMTGASIGAYGP